MEKYLVPLIINWSWQMALRQIRIGSSANVVQYDDAVEDSAIETDQPIKAGTPVAPTDVLRLGDLVDIIGVIYPIGGLYISTLGTNPNTLLGFGTWVAFGAGRVLVGLNAADADFDTSEETGGGKTSTPDAHSGAGVDAHSGMGVDAHSGVAVDAHTKVANIQGALPGNVVTTETHIVTQPVDHTVTQAANHVFTQSSAHAAMSIIQPYIVVYMWKRTA